MQICHVLKKAFDPERFDSLLVTLVWIISILVRVATGNPYHSLGWIAMIIAIFDCMRFIVVLAKRMAKLLRINVFAWTDKSKRD